MMTLTPAPAADTTPDADLLRAVAAGRAEAAFTELVRRHGPLVYGVCRRVLADRPEADDAFQAAFLVLARKAGVVRRPELLGNWLYGVALRCARRAKAAAAARWAKERPMTDLPAPPVPDADWADVRPILDAELGRLPDKLRAALVLCELQGLDRSAAAERLGVPEGTVSSRLARAKEVLRRRLVKRGLGLSAAGVAWVLAAATARAKVPPGLAADVVRIAAGAGAAPGPAALIAHKELSLMFWKNLLVAGLAAAGVAGLAGVGAWVGVPAAAAPAADDKKSDKDAIQGTWKLVTARFGDRDLPEQERNHINQTGMVFEAEKMTAPHAGSYKIDPSKKPKEIDLTIDDGPEDKRGTYKGVYELDGDKLTFNLGLPGQDRPTKVEAGDNTMHIVLERVKK